MNLRVWMMAAWCAAVGAQNKTALDKATMEAYVRHLVLYPPQVTVTVGDPKPSEVPGFFEVTVRATAGPASEDRTFFVSKDGQKIMEAKVYDVAQNPFKRELERLGTVNQPSMGTPGAPVVVVIFSDFQCEYCQKEGQSMRAELLKAFPTQVRVYFKDYPLEQIHDWSRAAAIAGRCVFRQKPAAFWDYHDWVFGKQTEIQAGNFTDKLAEFVKSKALDAAQMAACRASQSPVADIEKSIAEARALSVASTPTLFINGRRIAGYVPWENLKTILEFEIGYQAKAKNAGEQCCTLPTPSLLSPGQNPVLPKK